MKREISAKLLTWKSQKVRRPLILYGARQIGKTYTLKEFAAENFHQYHYLNFEEDPKLAHLFEADLKVDRIIRDLSIYLEKNINVTQDILILDEIQSCPKALTSLKYFSENMPELAVTAAGSLLGLELSPESYPVGKVEQLHMYPMRFMEFLLACNDEQSYKYLIDFNFDSPISKPVHEKLLQRLKEYFIVGGMPNVIKTFIENYARGHFTAYELVREEQSRIIASVFADIAKHSGKENAMNISKTWQYMPSKLDSNYDGSSSRFRFKEILPSKKRYQDFIGVLDWLEKANLVIRVPMIDHFNIPLNSTIKENIFKLYNYDVGILARLSNLSPKRILEHDYGRYKGFFVENFIAQELRCIRNNLDLLVSWKSKDHEVEFILSDRDGYPLPVEVKSGQSKNTTSLRKFIEQYKPKSKIIFSSDNFSKDAGNQVYRLPLYLPVDKLINAKITSR